MFALSSSLMLSHLASYILFPLVIGVIATWIIMGGRLRSWLFYLTSRFVGVGVLSYGLFLLQFVRYGIDRAAYAILIAFLLLVLVVRVLATSLKRKDLWKTLSLQRKIKSRKQMSNGHKAIAIVLILFLLTFLVTAFIFVTNLPSYADDAFGNWHMPVMNILYDGGVHIFGDTSEILGRGRLGYPIMIPAMQAFIANLIGGYNDIYINLFPWLSVLFFLGLIATWIYQKKKNLIAALIGPAVIISLPLLFMHTTQGYMDLLSATYTALAVMAFYDRLQKDGHASEFVLGIAFLSILSYVKNDGFVVYMSGVLIALILYSLIHRKKTKEKLHIFSKLSTRIYIIALILFFIAPFTFLKSYYNLGFNQAAGADAGLGLAASVHWEIFPAIWNTIWDLNNYSVAPVLFLMMLIRAFFRRKHMDREKLFLILAPVVILGIFLLVFLVTENYKFVLDQTTVNRVFTMVLVIFFAPMALLFPLAKEHHD